jgi:hypothetical protein
MKIIGILLFMFALPVLAQDHQHSSKVINGHEHPDQISDSDAYRLFFLIPFPKEPLGGEEREKIISAFRLEWDSRVAQYNAKATALNKAGKRADLKQFLAGRDALVEQTRKELAQTLPEKSIDELDDRVQQLKQWMAVSGGLQTSNDPCVTYSNNIALYWGLWPGGGGLGLPKNPQLADWNELPASMKFGIILDGAAIMTINPNACGQDAPDISAVTHTPELSVKLEQNPASQKGSAICADCYINAVMTETHSTTVGTQVGFSPEAVIHCSYGGDIF